MPRPLRYPELLQFRLPADTLARIARVVPDGMTAGEWGRELILEALERKEADNGRN